MRNANQLRSAARESLSGKWSGAVVMALIFYIFINAINGLVVATNEAATSAITVLLIPIGYSFKIAFLDNIRSGEQYKAGQMFSCFKDYIRMAGTGFLVYIYTFLWGLLLLVPGIIKALSYSLTPYILKDYPELKYDSAIELSMEMMKGHKWDLFCLYLTFIGWFLLSMLTFGIGFLWLQPYICAAMAHFYEDVKAEYAAGQLSK